MSNELYQFNWKQLSSDQFVQRFQETANRFSSGFYRNEYEQKITSAMLERLTVDSEFSDEEWCSFEAAYLKLHVGSSLQKDELIKLAQEVQLLSHRTLDCLKSISEEPARVLGPCGAMAIISPDTLGDSDKMKLVAEADGLTLHGFEDLSIEAFDLLKYYFGFTPLKQKKDSLNGEDAAYDINKKFEKDAVAELVSWNQRVGGAGISAEDFRECLNRASLEKDPRLAVWLFNRASLLLAEGAMGFHGSPDKTDNLLGIFRALVEFQPINEDFLDADKKALRLCFKLLKRLPHKSQEQVCELAIFIEKNVDRAGMRDSWSSNLLTAHMKSLVASVESWEAARSFEEALSVLGVSEDEDDDEDYEDMVESAIDVFKEKVPSFDQLTLLLKEGDLEKAEAKGLRWLKDCSENALGHVFQTIEKLYSEAMGSEQALPSEWRKLYVRRTLESLELSTLGACWELLGCPLSEGLVTVHIDAGEKRQKVLHDLRRLGELGMAQYVDQFGIYLGTDSYCDRTVQYIEDIQSLFPDTQIQVGAYRSETLRSQWGEYYQVIVEPNSGMIRMIKRYIRPDSGVKWSGLHKIDGKWTLLPIE